MFTKFSKPFQGRGKLGSRVAAFALAALALLVGSSAAQAQPQCRRVHGHYEEHIVSGPECTSTVGLCVAGTYKGRIHGTFFGAVNSLAPTDVGEVLLFTTDSTIHASFDGKEGDLIIKNAGAFQTAGTGHIVDLQYIVGGTGELSGASGVIRATGTFDSATGTGESDYEGEICVP